MRLAMAANLLLSVLMAAASPDGLADDRSSDSEPDYTAEQRNHWSFRKPVRPRIPEFKDESDRKWIRNAVDAFILRKLTQSGLQPAPEADRRTLIRRVYFNLLGLPPPPKQVQAFVDDGSPTAYADLIDQVLRSPHYGERWGQHWLDVVRFAETEGFEYDRHHANAWRFRDYVIRSFNQDKPYDKFIVEQLAGDEIANSETDREPLVAAGFHRLGPVRRNAGNAEVAFSRNEVLTERTDVIGVTFLGLTVGCARCHDHMFDPIRQKDYYRMQAFLAATHEHDISLASVADEEQWQEQTDKINVEIDRIKQALTNASAAAEPKLREELANAQSRLPKPLPTVFSVKNVEKNRTTIHLLKRGNENNKGERLGMRVPGVLLPAGTAEMPGDTSQPKTLLARWIADADNPLTARVMVNRIWLHHFGQGLVRTPNDFGRNGSPPSHPELLDILASEFVRGGWRIKAIHRLIMLSSTYRQSSRNPNETRALQADPKNRLLWRFNRRRLDAEEIRDSVLAVSGQLNRKAGGPSITVPVSKELVDLLYKPSQWEVTKDPREHDRRSVYLIAKRNLRLPFLDVFDQPDLQTSCARRVTSTHAPQSLELLNGELSNRLARTFAARLRKEAGEDRGRQIERAFLLATSRLPSDAQRRISRQFLKTQSLTEFSLAMFNLNAFLYVE